MNHSPLILATALLCSTFSSLSAMPSCCGSSKTLGLQLYSLRDAMKEDPEGTIAKVGAMGFHFVETAGYHEGKFYGMTPKAFSRVLEKNSLEFLSSHTGQDLPGETNRDKVMAWWDQAIEAHLEAGVNYIVQPWMGEAGFESLDGLKRYCDYFNEVGARCRAKGIRFGFHNHAKEFGTLEGVTIYDYMLENTDPENVFFQIDLYWAVEGGKNPLDYFTRYPGRFLLWHVKDETELGASGKMDFANLFTGLEKSGAKHLIVEQEKYNFEPLVSVEKSLRFLLDAPFVP
jgi:sugar phosphate isomerase/epimerase